MIHMLKWKCLLTSSHVTHSRSEVGHTGLKNYQWLNRWMRAHLHTKVKLIDCLRILSCICPSLSAPSSSSCHGDRAPSLSCSAPWLPAPVASGGRDNLGLSCCNRSFDWPQSHKQLEDVCLDLRRKSQPMSVSRLQSDKWWDYYDVRWEERHGKMICLHLCERSWSPHCITVRYLGENSRVCF